MLLRTNYFCFELERSCIEVSATHHCLLQTMLSGKSTLRIALCIRCTGREATAILLTISVKKKTKPFRFEKKVKEFKFHCHIQKRLCCNTLSLKTKTSGNGEIL